MSVIEMSILQFALIYVLLIVVAIIMKIAGVKESKTLLFCSVRMTIQLILAGLILTYILNNPEPIYVVIYLSAMLIFSIVRVFSKNKELSEKFKIIIAIAMIVSTLSIIICFLLAVIGVSVFNPQYAIPLGGMIIGNSMTGILIGLKSFKDSLEKEKVKQEALLNLGVAPKDILCPYVNSSFSTAVIPTINSMVGMGIIFLPGMMTGQILSGVMPMTAIMYQIAIVIAFSSSTCIAIFIALYFGTRTLYNKKNQLNY